VKLNRSWRTSSAGIGAILIGLGGLASDYGANGHISIPALTAAFGSIITGIGLMLARDNNKSSVDVGIQSAVPKQIASEVVTPEKQT